MGLIRGARSRTLEALRRVDALLVDACSPFRGLVLLQAIFKFEHREIDVGG